MIRPSKPNVLRRPRRRARAAILTTLSVSALLAGGLCSLASAAEPTPIVKTTDLPNTVGEPFLRLLDQNLPLAERRAAAMSLLNVGNRDSLRALSSAVTEGASPIAWRAVAEGVALHPKDPPAELVNPMLVLLLKSDGATQAALAEALGRYRQPDLVQRLSALANDASRSTSARRGAILALGHHRTQQVAGDLISLSGANHPDAVQDAAFRALATLTGLEEYGRDRAAWLDWWNSARRWSQARWQERLMGSLTRRDALRRQQQQVIEDRLLESQRALFRITTPEDRPAVLAYMLGDALEPIRHLAIDLALQRLLEDQPFEEPLRQALRSRLTDSSPTMRERAARLLRDLADAPAADKVADLLARRTEQNGGVLRSYLLLMARLPRHGAVAPAMELLEEAALRGEAAAVLAAAAEAGMLERREAQAAAKRVRRFLDDGHPPAPVATLLARVGDEDDWALIAKWIDSGDTSLKRAAAAAWADSSRSLKLLADRVRDPAIEPIVLAAAVRRGDDPWTFRALSEHRPQQPQAGEAWREALVAMSARVQPSVVLENVQRVEAAGNPATPPGTSGSVAADAGLLDRMLSAAINRDTPNVPSPGERIRLLLKRAEMRLASGNPAAALQDYNRVVAAEAQLPADARLGGDAVDRLARGRVQAHLQVGEVDEALEAARGLLGTKPGAGMHGTDDPVIDQFLDAARVHSEAGRRDAARKLLTRLRVLLGPAIKPEIAQRIALLEAELVERHPAPIIRENDVPPRSTHTAAE